MIAQKNDSFIFAWFPHVDEDTGNTVWLQRMWRWRKPYTAIKEHSPFWSYSVKERKTP